MHKNNKEKSPRGGDKYVRDPPLLFLAFYSGASRILYIKEADKRIAFHRVDVWRTETFEFHDHYRQNKSQLLLKYQEVFIPNSVILGKRNKYTLVLSYYF